MGVTLHLVVFFGFFMSAISKDIFDIYEELRPEQQADLFEGDIKLTPEQRAMIDQIGERKATSNIALRWPRVGANTQVPYVISTSSASDTTVIEEAIRHWESKACIDLIPRTDQRDYIEFIKADGCYSQLGKIGRKQTISIGNGCAYMGIVAHEIGHAIGFFHEHSRPDRDDYITVHFANIQSDNIGQFDKKQLSEVETGNVPYDVGSIMHYGSTAFSKNGQPTITTKNPADNSKLGNRQALSAADIALANTILGCPLDGVCSSGWERHNRDLVDSSGWTMVSPSKVIECNGLISKWLYNAKSANPFRAIVWRLIPGASTQFQIIGINDIPAGAVGTEVAFEVPFNDRISVKAGDMIGWSFGEAVLAWNYGGGTLVRWLGGNLHASLLKDQTHDINDGSQDREYSIKAIVQDDPNVCPFGWIPNGESCYKLQGISSFTSGQSACQQEDPASYVVVVNDAEENAFVASLVSDWGIAWLGCNATGGNQLWTCPDGSGKTFDGNTKTASPANSYWNWYYNSEGELPYPGECQIMNKAWGNAWSSAPCPSQLPVICEKQK